MSNTQTAWAILLGIMMILMAAIPPWTMHCDERFRGDSDWKRVQKNTRSIEWNILRGPPRDCDFEGFLYPYEYKNVEIHIDWASLVLQEVVAGGIMLGILALARSKPNS